MAANQDYGCEESLLLCTSCHKTDEDMVTMKTWKVALWL